MSIKEWRKVDSKIILDHPRLRIVEDKVILPNGNSTTYIHAPTVGKSVAIIALNKAGEILLQREYSYPCNSILWQFPGGVFEQGEDIIQASNRELSEESGYVAKDTRIIGWYYTDNRRSNAKQYVVLCKNLIQNKQKADPEEFIENHWVTFDKLTQLISNGEIHSINLLAALSLWKMKRSNNH